MAAQTLAKTAIDGLAAKLALTEPAPALTPPQRSATSTSTQYGITYESTTANDRDHAFSGIMFDVRCRALLPVAHVEVVALSVRGDLGPMTVHCFDGGAWRRVYDADHAPSPDELAPLRLAAPVRVTSGSRARVYVHSAREFSAGGRAPDSVVYASRTANVTDEDATIQILPGVAHTSSVPFSDRGFWPGPAWRPHRAFVGKLEYDVRWLCWNPDASHRRFPRTFRRMALEVVRCWSRAGEGALWRLPKETVFYVLNFCSWDWAYAAPDLARLAEDARADAAAGFPSPQAAELARATRDDEDLVGVRDRFGAVVMLPRSQARASFWDGGMNESDDDEEEDDDAAGDG